MIQVLKSMKKLLTVLLMSFALQALSAAKTPDCEKWQSLVVGSVHSMNQVWVLPVKRSPGPLGLQVHVGENQDPYGVRFMNDGQILEGISCLLKLRGRREASRYAGATSMEISQFVGRASVEVMALYYITYLFKGIYDHAFGYVLLDSLQPPLKDEIGALITRDQDAAQAFKCYIRWFKKIKKIGLVAARQRHLDPLAGTSLQWYGEHDPQTLCVGQQFYSLPCNIR
jgi:hypothetical protein